MDLVTIYIVRLELNRWGKKRRWAAKAMFRKIHRMHRTSIHASAGFMKYRSHIWAKSRKKALGDRKRQFGLNEGSSSRMMLRNICTYVKSFLFPRRRCPQIRNHRGEKERARGVQQVQEWAISNGGGRIRIAPKGVPVPYVILCAESSATRVFNLG